jgi:glycosyltransferase involved in cell wall biosynthesis
MILYAAKKLLCYSEHKQSLDLFAMGHEIMSELARSLSIIIPAYNEEHGIGPTLADLIAHPRLARAEIIVVNDGSADRTAEVAAQHDRVKVVSHLRNQGYGSAVSTGIRQARHDYVIWYDSDGQHRPDDLLKVYDELTQKQLDYCIGVRDERSHTVRSRQFGKQVLRLVVNIAAGQKVADFNSGLRGFRRDVIAGYLHLFPKGFSASTTTTLLMLEQGYNGTEVGIVVKERVGQSTVKQFRDGSRTLMIILRIMLMFKPMRFFGSLGIVLVLFGSAYGFAEAIALGEGFPVFGALSIIFGFQTLFFGLLADQIAQIRQERLIYPDHMLSRDKTPDEN